MPRRPLGLVGVALTAAQSRPCGWPPARASRDITRFFPRIDQNFPGEALNPFLVLTGKMEDFRNFVLDNCILDFDAEQVYLKLQVINLKNKEVTVNPKPQTLEKNGVFENPIP